MTTTKAEWRRKLLAERGAVEASVRRRLSAAIAARVIAEPAFASSRSIVTYIAVGAEVDPSGITTPRLDGRAVYVPSATAPVFRRVSVEYGAPEMSPDPERPALVVVPGVGFDLLGVRLGRGQGYYDRALRDLRAGGQTTVVGVAFECQIVARLPYDPWDEPMDMVVSESRTIVPQRLEADESAAADDRSRV